MKSLLLSSIRLSMILIYGYYCYNLGKDTGLKLGKVSGCQYAYRDLYTKYGIKNIDEVSLLKFCQEKNK